MLEFIAGMIVGNILTSKKETLPEHPQAFGYKGEQSQLSLDQFNESMTRQLQQFNQQITKE